MSSPHPKSDPDPTPSLRMTIAGEGTSRRYHRSRPARKVTCDRLRVLLRDSPDGIIRTSSQPAAQPSWSTFPCEMHAITMSGRERQALFCSPSQQHPTYVEAPSMFWVSLGRLISVPTMSWERRHHGGDRPSKRLRLIVDGYYVPGLSKPGLSKRHEVGVGIETSAIKHKIYPSSKPHARQGIYPLNCRLSQHGK